MANGKMKTDCRDCLGKVYLVGAGPGDVGLITIRGRELIAGADVIVYDHLIADTLLRYARDNAELIYVGKQAGAHSLPQDEINALLVEQAERGKMVVRLKGGDPFVFGRGGEEAEELARAGIAFEVVPGITAAVAAAAYAGIPLTHRDYASQVSFITGHQADAADDEAIDWSLLAKSPGTLAFYMGVKNLPKISRLLIEHGMTAETPAAVIQAGTTPEQKTVTATIADLPELAVKEQIKPPAMIVIGAVVKLRQRLNWFEKLPLFARQIVVTRARSQASDMANQLGRLGAAVVEFPTIKIAAPDDAAPLEQAAENIGKYDWLVLTSVNGVDAFFAKLNAAGYDSRKLAGVNICVIGPATAERLAEHGLKADLMPQRFIAEAIVETLECEIDIAGKRFLLARADIARADLAQMLRQRGAAVDDIIAYQTLIDHGPRDKLLAALADDSIDWITFTSSSTVNNFFSQVEPQLLKNTKAKLASIGPQTTERIQSFGFNPAVEAKQYTIDELIKAVCEYEKRA